MFLDFKLCSEFLTYIQLLDFSRIQTVNIYIYWEVILLLQNGVSFPRFQFRLIITEYRELTSLKEWTSLPQSQASQPASLAPHISFLRSSPTCTASSGFTPNNSQAFKNIVGFGFSAATCLEREREQKVINNKTSSKDRRNFA